MVAPPTVHPKANPGIDAPSRERVRIVCKSPEVADLFPLAGLSRGYAPFRFPLPCNRFWVEGKDMAELEVDAQDVVRLMLQFCKENGLKVLYPLQAWTMRRAQPLLSCTCLGRQLRQRCCARACGRRWSPMRVRYAGHGCVCGASIHTTV